MRDVMARVKRACALAALDVTTLALWRPVKTKTCDACGRSWEVPRA